MKKLAFLIISVLLFETAFSQWEFQYFVFKAGLIHNAFSAQPDSDNILFLKTFEGERKLYPDTAYFFDYVPGFSIGLDFHFDFTNDMGGIIIGAHYLTYGFSSKYITENANYWLIQKYRIHSLSIPFYVKFGKEIFDQQRYFTFGVRYNINFAMQIIEQVNWLDRPTIFKAEKNMFDNGNYLIFFGFNYTIFNIEFDFQPDNFLNKNYSLNIGTPNKKIISYPFESQPKNLFYLSTNITIPLSPWITNKSYFFKRLFRRLRIR